MIPNSADQCGLIRKSDVERLISYLKTSDTKDKDTESNNDECRLDSVSPTGRKRSQSPFSSGPPTRSTSALSHENSIPTDTNEYCPIVKKPKPNVLETELTETTHSTYNLSNSPSEFPSDPEHKAFIRLRFGTEQEASFDKLDGSSSPEAPSDTSISLLRRLTLSVEPIRCRLVFNEPLFDLTRPPDCFEEAPFVEDFFFFPPFFAAKKKEKSNITISTKQRTSTETKY